MKKTLLLGLFFLIFSQIFGQNQRLDLGDLQSPAMKWEQESYDFGDIEQHKPVVVNFKFKNIGNAPLILSNVEASCGCTNVDYKKAPIMPGQSGEISVTFDAEDLGIFSKSVTVTANTNPAQTILRFSGEVKKK